MNTKLKVLFRITQRCIWLSAVLTNPGCAAPNGPGPASGSEIPPVLPARTNGVEKSIAAGIAMVGKPIAETKLFTGNWREQEMLNLTNCSEVFPPFEGVSLLWETNRGMIHLFGVRAIMRPSAGHEDLYSRGYAFLLKAYGPPDDEDLSVLINGPHHCHWILRGTSIKLERRPVKTEQGEAMDYSFLFAATHPSAANQAIDGAFGYKLGSVMPAEVLQSAQSNEKGGVVAEVKGIKPHPSFNHYGVCMVPSNGKVFGIMGAIGVVDRNSDSVVDAFQSMLRYARSWYDWDTCEYEKQKTSQSVTLKKGARSISITLKFDKNQVLSSGVMFYDDDIAYEALLQASRK